MVLFTQKQSQCLISWQVFRLKLFGKNLFQRNKPTVIRTMSGVFIVIKRPNFGYFTAQLV